MDRLSPQTPQAGTKLDGYELLCPIAQGGMAVVWLARATLANGRLVVVKMLLPQYASDEQFQQMFVDEANIASGISHPNVARILDAGEANHTPYLVMEYIDGESIARLSETAKKAGTPIPVGIALRLIADAASGLHAAHELRGRDGALLNVVHRDVSPQNVLVRNVGSAALIDFGIAKARERLAEETRAGNLKGKVRYMAPEQALGKAVDRRVDVWALGAMLFEIFAGKGPYDGGSEIAALQRLVKGQKPAELPATVPEPVRSVVARALEPNRDLRFATAQDLERALVETIAALGVPASPADVSAFAAPFMRERSQARYAAARDAMVTLDARAGSRAPVLHATASGGYVALSVDEADEATQINYRFSVDELPDDPRDLDFGRGNAPKAPPAIEGFGVPDFAVPSTAPPPPPALSSRPPAANIAQSISDVLSSGFGPTGTLPPPPSGGAFGGPLTVGPMLGPSAPLVGADPSRALAPSPAADPSTPSPLATAPAPKRGAGAKIALVLVVLVLAAAAALAALRFSGRV